MRIPIIMLLAIVSASCADTHNIRRAGGSSLVLEKNASAYVAQPFDGRFEQTVYQDSGRITAVEVTRAFSPHLAITTQASRVESRDQALESAKIGNYTYLIMPEILHWEDRATEWSGLPDKITVDVKVIDVATGTVLDGAQIDGKSKWATLGGDHPEDLLEKPLSDYARSLFP